MNEKKESLHLLIPKQLKNELTERAEQAGYCRSVFIRQILELYCEYLADKDLNEAD